MFAVIFEVNPRAEAPQYFGPVSFRP